MKPTFTIKFVLFLALTWFATGSTYGGFPSLGGLLGSAIDQITDNMGGYGRCGALAAKLSLSPDKGRVQAAQDSCVGDPPDSLPSFIDKISDPVCGVWNGIGGNCQNFVTRCTIDGYTCKLAIDTLLQCIPYVQQVSDALRKLGVNAAEELVKHSTQLRKQAAECGGEPELKPESVPQYYSQTCDDQTPAPVNFYTLNNNYYTVKSAAERSALLDRYADQPVGEQYERIVVTTLALDSLQSSSAIERAAAARVVATHGNYSAAVLYNLIDLTADRKALVRKEAARALGFQGNKGFLVNMRLIQLLGDPDPYVRAEAAVALKTQAVAQSCPDITVRSRDGTTESISGYSYETLFYANPQVDPRTLQFTVPQCHLYRQEDHPNPLDEGDFLSSLSKTYGCPEVPSMESRIFDRVQSLKDIKDFDILNNHCKILVPSHTEKVMEFAAQAVLEAIAPLNTKKPAELYAKAMLISALRTLGRGNLSLMQDIYQWMAVDQPEIRAAATYAASSVAAADPQLLAKLQQRLSDPDPSVRRIAVGAVGENAILDINQDIKTFQAYSAGVDYFYTQKVSCTDVAALTMGANANPYNSEKEIGLYNYFKSGLNTAQLEAMDTCNHQTNPDAPVILASNPRLRTGFFLGPEFSLQLNGRYAETELKKNIAVLSQASQGIPIPFRSFKTDISEERTLGRTVYTTTIHFTLQDPLIPGKAASLVINSNLKTIDGVGFPKYDKPKSLPQKARKIGFRTPVTELFATIDKLLLMLKEDPEYSVRFAIAGVLLPYLAHERLVFEFLKQSMVTRPEARILRARPYFDKSIFKYRFVRDMPDEDKVKFLRKFVYFLREDIDKHEGGVITKPDSFTAIPILRAQYEVIEDLLKRNLISKEQMALELKKPDADGIAFYDWLWAKIARTKPLEGENQRFSFYDRQLLPQVRSLWISIFDYLFKTDKNGSALDRLYGEVVGPKDGEPDDPDLLRQ